VGHYAIYCRYYERSRTHLSLEKDAPIPRPIAAISQGRIVAIPQVGGLYHRYEHRAAQQPVRGTGLVSTPATGAARLSFLFDQAPFDLRDQSYESLP
jgi:hypothetical protein